MWQQIHDVEIDTSEPVVRALLGEHLGHYGDAMISYVDTSGTSNVMWRVHADDQDLLVRLPRTEDAATSVAFECELLPALAQTEVAAQFAIPEVRHVGVPTERFPHPWAVFSWVDGDDVWSHRATLNPHQNDLAVDLATGVRLVASVDDVAAPQRRPGGRGGPLPELLETLERWLTDPQWRANDLVDVAAVRRSAAESAEVGSEPVEACFLHGDLIPGNLLTVDGRLAAIIDWGGAGYGDPAQDLAPAWSVFDADARAIFRAQLEVDDATWLRARAFELEHAVGGITYYQPRGHALADVMRQTLDRILSGP